MKLMQYRRDLIPHPFAIRRRRFGSRIPHVVPSAVPHWHWRRLRTIERAAPESAREAIHGLGALGNEGMLPGTSAPNAGGGFWSSAGSILSSDATAGLIKAGVNFYTARESSRLDRRAAGQQAATLAMQTELARQQQLASQRAASASKPGMPAWVIPTAIGGAVVIGAVLFLRRK